MSHKYLVSISVILIITGFSKLSALGSSASIFLLDAPLLFFSYRTVLVVISIVELSLACYIIFGNNNYLKYVLLLTLGFSFLFYRVSLLYIGLGGYCPCLGSLTINGKIISNEIINLFMYVIIGYMLIPSAYFIYAYYIDYDE